MNCKMQVPLTAFGMEPPSEFDSMMSWVDAEVIMSGYAAELREKERAAQAAECATGATTIP
jgi:hypothetical protein